MENLKRVRFKALLVDDEEEILKLSKTFFEKEEDSLELETASSPKRALKLMEEENFDVVVSDYRMPEMDGIDLWERIKENGDRPSFLLFTGRGDEEVAMKALNRGVDGYIKKKTDFESQFQELKEKIREKAGKRDGSTALEDGYGKSPLLESFDQDCEFPSDEGKLADVLSVLSKRGSFEILKSADSGMRSARGRWNDFGLSKKQYYTRLRSLQEADLLDKEVDEYRTTGRGRKVLNLLFLLGVTVGDPDDMEGMEPGEVESVERRGLNELLGNGSDDLQLKEFESVGDYDPFVERANGLIADAERDLSIFLTFSDRRILNSLLRANEDVEIRILMPEQPLTNLKGILSTLGREKREKFKELAEKSMKVCSYQNFPFSFFLKDGEALLLELYNPLNPTRFFDGVLCRNEETYDSFSTLFDECYREGEDRAMPRERRLETFE